MHSQAESADVGVQEGDPSRLVAPVRYLGRQPIVDEKSRLYGYELLFRAGAEDHFSGDRESATQQVVDHWLMLTPESDSTVAFVNCTRAFLVDGLVSILQPAQTVLEIPRDVEPDAELLAACRELKKQGYRIALDDFFPDPAHAQLLGLADFIKIDFQATSAAMRHDIYKMLAGSWALRIAVKIETEEEMRTARAEGCMLFQGYFFSRPVLVSSPTIPQNRLVYLRLLAALQEEPADLRQVESLVLSDATLCYRVLRLANSAMQGHASEITRVREALLMVGDNAMRRMVTVALAGVLGGHRPPALVSMALARARFCELAAPKLAMDAPRLYLLGMLSLLDALLETSMDRILRNLPLGDEMKEALLGEGGPLSPALDMIRALEACDWQRCEPLRQAAGVSESDIASMYVESLHWAAKSLEA